MKIPSRATTLDHRRSSSRCAVNVLLSALNPEATQADQQMQASATSTILARCLCYETSQSTVSDSTSQPSSS